MGSAEWLDPVNGQFSQELRFAKSVLRGMIEKSAIDPSIQSGAGYIFKEEEPGGLENTLNFSYTCLPFHDMMKHSEVEDSIEVFIRKGRLSTLPTARTTRPSDFACESPLRAVNLLRVEVDSVDLTCAEPRRFPLQLFCQSMREVVEPCGSLPIAFLSAFSVARCFPGFEFSVRRLSFRPAGADGKNQGRRRGSAWR
jgi:hypothetical protein